MSQEDHNTRLHSLLLSALDGDASADDVRELNELVRADTVAQDSAARFLYDDALLSDEVATLRSASVLRSDNEVPLATLRPRDDQSSWGRRALRSGWLVAAASIVLALFATWRYAAISDEMAELHNMAAAPDPFQMESLQDSRPQRAEDRVARVTGLIDCQWPDGAEPLAFGDWLQVGQEIQLDSGVVQLTLQTGARLLVEGPAEFVTSSRWETDLALGRVAVAVPRSARGFTVLTPTAEIVDLGTEFGVEVERSGASQFHVFDGEVIARRRGTKGDSIHAVVEQAYRFDSAENDPKALSGIGDSFVRRMSVNSAEPPALPVTAGLSLWLASDRIPDTAEGEPVSLWPDLLVGDNKFADDALQFEERLCPKLEFDDHDRPAVRFNGWSTSLVTGPTEVTQTQTMFVVCDPDPVCLARHQNGGVVLRTGPLAVAMRPDRKPIGWLWTGRNPYHVGTSVGMGISAGTPSVLAYTYDSSSDQAFISVNGSPSEAVRAPTSLPTQSRRYIGRSDLVSQDQYFNGKLYEVLIFEDQLTEAQRVQINEYLAERYDVGG